MVKKIVVHKCEDCPHRKYYCGKIQCGQMGKKLADEDLKTYFPKWCPLEENT
jgi:hypothetical protein